MTDEVVRGGSASGKTASSGFFADGVAPDVKSVVEGETGEVSVALAGSPFNQRLRTEREEDGEVGEDGKSLPPSEDNQLGIVLLGLCDRLVVLKSSKDVIDVAWLLEYDEFAVGR